ncbi:MAG: hypothetical protein OXE96_02305 [Gemmatimonadetes bacterium]|nr:hypothetical protein [Gemmatimonadota bacterium]
MRGRPRLRLRHLGVLVGAALVDTAVMAQATAQPVVPPCEPVLDHATAEVSEFARFNLGPAPGQEGCGLAEVVGAWSPFGLAVMRSGHLAQQLRLVLDLPPVEGRARYVAWVATPALDRIESLGTVTAREPFTVPVHWNKMVIVVSREDGLPAADAPRWSGPVVLLGRSRSALLQNLMGHSIFRRAEM